MMLDFTEDKLTDERVIEIAEKDGLPPLRGAISAALENSWEPNLKVYEGEHPNRLPYHLRYSEEEVEKAVEFYRKAKSLLNGK